MAHGPYGPLCMVHWIGRKPLWKTSLCCCVFQYPFTICNTDLHHIGLQKASQIHLLFYLTPRTQKLDGLSQEGPPIPTSQTSILLLRSCSSRCRSDSWSPPPAWTGHSLASTEGPGRFDSGCGGVQVKGWNLKVQLYEHSITSYDESSVQRLSWTKSKVQHSNMSLSKVEREGVRRINNIKLSGCPLSKAHLASQSQTTWLKWRELRESHE